MSDVALCRVCLACDIKMYNVANTRYQEIFESLSTKLCTADRRPETVCYICFSHLQRCRRFMDMSRKAEAILTQFSCSGIQVRNENVAKLHLRMRPPLSVATANDLFSTHANSHVILKEEKSVKEEETAEDETFVEIETGSFKSPKRCNIKYENLKFEVDTDYVVLNEQPPTFVVEQTTLNTAHSCETKTHSCETATHSSETTTQSCEITTDSCETMTHSCQTCSNIFRSKLELEVHLKRSHTRQSPYSCYKLECQKQFKHKSDLTRHMRTHTGEKPYVCDMCNKKFNSNWNLKIHMKVHTRELPYTCKVCHNGFKTKTDLITHMRVHTDDETLWRFVCDVCNKEYKQKNNLARHMGVHTDEMPEPYVCNLCHKEFKHKRTLNSHIKGHAKRANTLKKLKYACNICDMRFDRKRSLDRHSKVHWKVGPCPILRPISILPKPMPHMYVIPLIPSQNTQSILP